MHSLVAICVLRDFAYPRNDGILNSVRDIPTCFCVYRRTLSIKVVRHHFVPSMHIFWRWLMYLGWKREEVSVAYSYFAHFLFLATLHLYSILRGMVLGRLILLVCLHYCYLLLFAFLILHFC